MITKFSTECHLACEIQNVCSMAYRQSEMYNRAKYLKIYHYSV